MTWREEEEESSDRDGDGRVDSHDVSNCRTNRVKRTLGLGKADGYWFAGQSTALSGRLPLSFIVIVYPTTNNHNGPEGKHCANTK